MEKKTKKNIFTHIDEKGRAVMVDISDKDKSLRTASAKGFIRVNSEILKKISENKIEKGDVFCVARIAAISAAKKTWELIPLCHQINLSTIEIEFEVISEKNIIKAESKIKGLDRTGVEMEALAAVSVGLLAIYDMCKAVSKEMTIENIELVKKSGGKSDYEIRQ